MSKSFGIRHEKGKDYVEIDAVIEICKEHRDRFPLDSEIYRSLNELYKEWLKLVELLKSKKIIRLTENRIN